MIVVRHTLAEVRQFLTIGWINHCNKAIGHYFWSPATRRHFRDKTSNWKVFFVEGKVFICSKVSGEVRQVLSDFSIGCPLQLDQKRVIVDDAREFKGLYADIVAADEIKDEILYRIVE